MELGHAIRIRGSGFEIYWLGGRVLRRIQRDGRQHPGGGGTDVSCYANFERRPLVFVGVVKLGTGTGRITSTPPGLDCGPTCEAGFSEGATVTVTRYPDAGSIFIEWGGACSGSGLTSSVNLGAQAVLCSARFDSDGATAVAVRLDPFGMRSLSDGPFTIQAIDASGAAAAAPQDITVTLLREVVSPCRGVLFSSNRTITVPQGQSSIAALDAAGRDPLCNTSPTRTEWTVRGATMGVGPLDMSDVRIQELFVSISR